MTVFTFRMDHAAEWPNNTAKGYGKTEAEARADLEHDFPGLVRECISGPEEYDLGIKTDFGPNGPQPGTVAYTAFIMAQLCPGGDTGEDDFWDNWKDDMLEGLL